MCWCVSSRRDRVERLGQQQRHAFSHALAFRHRSPPRASPASAFFNVSMARNTRVFTAPSEQPAICAISAYDSPWYRDSRIASRCSGVSAAARFWTRCSFSRRSRLRSGACSLGRRKRDQHVFRFLRLVVRLPQVVTAPVRRDREKPGRQLCVPMKLIRMLEHLDEDFLYREPDPDESSRSGGVRLVSRRGSPSRTS